MVVGLLGNKSPYSNRFTLVFQSLRMMYDYKLNLVVRTPRACLWESSAVRYGMSYTTFDVATENAAWKPDAESKTITVTVKVTNTGSCDGKEVVQIYAACPFGKLKKRENVWSLLKNSTAAAGRIRDTAP